MVILPNEKWGIRNVFSFLTAYAKTHKNTHSESFPTTLERQSLCNPMNCSPPCSSVLGTSQAKMLKWVAISFSRDLPDPEIEPMSPALPGRFFTTKSPEKITDDYTSGNTAYKKWSIRNVFFFLRATEKIHKSTHSRSFPTTLERKSISLSGTFSVLVLIS